MTRCWMTVVEAFGLAGSIQLRGSAEKRAPSRAAFCSTWCSRIMSPKSIIIRKIRASSCSTMAISTATAPRSRVLWAGLIAHQRLTGKGHVQSPEHLQRDGLVVHLHAHPRKFRFYFSSLDDHRPLDADRGLVCNSG